MSGAELAAEVGVAVDKGEQRPYAPSWVNRITTWIDRLPGPAWIWYVGIGVVSASASHALLWLNGLIPTGKIEPAQIYYGVLFAGSLWLIHHLDGVARRALDAFMPALDAAPEQIARWRYELTVIPSRGAWVILAAIAIFTLPYYGADPVGAQIVGYWPITLAFRAVYELLTSAVLVVLLWHSLRQLRLVSRIHREAVRVDLFESAPLYAFSRLTSQTAIGVLLLQSPTVFLIPTTELGTLTWLAWLVPVSLVCVAIFIGPLVGMHRRIQEEKGRLGDEVGSRLATTIADLHASVDTRDLASADALNKNLNSLITEHAFVGKLPTWPWNTGTVAAFASAIALPIALWLVTRLLERVV